MHTNEACGVRGRVRVGNRECTVKRLKLWYGGTSHEGRGVTLPCLGRRYRLKLCVEYLVLAKCRISPSSLSLDIFFVEQFKWQS